MTVGERMRQLEAIWDERGYHTMSEEREYVQLEAHADFGLKGGEYDLNTGVVTPKDEDTSVYCKGCVERNIALGITDAESCALLVPYEGDDVCSECGLHPATLAEPDEVESN